MDAITREERDATVAGRVLQWFVAEEWVLQDADAAFVRAAARMLTAEELYTVFAGLMWDSQFDETIDFSDFRLRCIRQVEGLR